MKKLVTAAAAIALVVSAGAAHAQAEPGDLGIFADAEGTQTTLDVNPFVDFSVYAVAFDLPDFNAYELSVGGIGDLGLIVRDEFLFGPAPLNVGSGPQNYIVGTGACVEQAGPLALVEIVLLATDPVPSDSPICVGVSDPFTLDDPLPAYNTCGNVVTAFGVATNGGQDYPDGCLILNATGDAPVDNETSSFGEVKARF
jgi:hypothetical protein